MTSTAARASDVEARGEAGLRAQVYALLGRLLSAPPNSETLSLLSSVDGRPAGGTGDLGECWRELQSAARETSVEALADEFHALFIGVGRGELLPYGSWYLTGFLMERPLARLREDLARLGFERRDDIRDPEDHAAIVCEVMAALASGEDEFDPATRASFFRRHVGSWMGRFFADLSRAKSAGFYRRVGCFGERFIDVESRFYGDSPAASPDAARRSTATAGAGRNGG